jgi:hypothetical protein
MLCASMLSLWANIAAIFFVVGSNGLGAMPGVLESFVHLVYWPCRFFGITPERYFQPNLIWPIIVNVVVWLVVTLPVGLAHHALGLLATRSARS